MIVFQEYCRVIDSHSSGSDVGKLLIYSSGKAIECIIKDIVNDGGNEMEGVGMKSYAFISSWGDRVLLEAVAQDFSGGGTNPKPKTPSPDEPPMIANNRMNNYMREQEEKKKKIAEEVNRGIDALYNEYGNHPDLQRYLADFIAKYCITNNLDPIVVLGMEEVQTSINKYSTFNEEFVNHFADSYELTIQRNINSQIKEFVPQATKLIRDMLYDAGKFSWKFDYCADEYLNKIMEEYARSGSGLSMYEYYIYKVKSDFGVDLRIDTRTSGTKILDGITKGIQGAVDTIVSLPALLDPDTWVGIGETIYSWAVLTPEELRTRVVEEKHYDTIITAVVGTVVALTFPISGPAMAAAMAVGGLFLYEATNLAFDHGFSFDSFYDERGITGFEEYFGMMLAQSAATAAGAAGSYVVTSWVQEQIGTLLNKVKGLLNTPEIEKIRIIDGNKEYNVNGEWITENQFKALRSDAVTKAWQAEVELVKGTGKGTRNWTQTEIDELLINGKVSGYEGQHMKSATAYPDYAGNPDNIQFLKGRGDYGNDWVNEHLDAHKGSWRNPTNWHYDPEGNIYT